jgi:hypothetical protein
MNIASEYNLSLYWLHFIHGYSKKLYKGVSDFVSPRAPKILGPALGTLLPDICSSTYNDVLKMHNAHNTETT